MPGTYPVVPASLVVVPVLIAALVAMLRLLYRRHALDLERAAVALVACVYAGGVLRSVLLPFPIRVGAARDGMAPWHAYLQLVPFYDHDPTGYLLNVALFVPLGALLPFLARVSSVRTAALIGFLLSLLVEVVQFVLVISVTSGRVADVDDLIANTIGAVLGFALLRAAGTLPALARLTTAATWPARGQQG